jgi:hypothetical protein
VHPLYARRGNQEKQNASIVGDGGLLSGAAEGHFDLCASVIFTSFDADVFRGLVAMRGHRLPTQQLRILPIFGFLPIEQK